MPVGSDDSKKTMGEVLKSKSTLNDNSMAKKQDEKKSQARIDELKEQQQKQLEEFKQSLNEVQENVEGVTAGVTGKVSGALSSTLLGPFGNIFEDLTGVNIGESIGSGIGGAMGSATGSVGGVFGPKEDELDEIAAQAAINPPISETDQITADMAVEQRDILAQMYGHDVSEAREDELDIENIEEDDTQKSGALGGLMRMLTNPGFLLTALGGAAFIGLMAHDFLSVGLAKFQSGDIFGGIMDTLFGKEAEVQSDVWGNMLKQAGKWGALGFMVGGPIGGVIGAGIGALVSGIKGAFDLEWDQNVEEAGRSVAEVWNDPNLGFFEKITGSLSGMGQGLLGAIAGGVRNVTEAFGPIVGEFQSIWADDSKDLFTKIIETLLEGGKALIEIPRIFFGGIFEKVGEFFGGMFGDGGTEADEINGVAESHSDSIIDKALGFAGAVFAPIAEIFGAIGANIGPLVEAGSELIGSLVKLVVPIFTKGLEFIEQTIKVLAPIVETGIQIIGMLVRVVAPVIDKAIRIIGNLAVQFAPVMDTILDVVEEVSLTMMPIIQEAAVAVGNLIVAFGPTVGKIVTLVSDLGERLQPVIDKAVDIVGSLINLLIPIISSMVDFVGGIVDVILGIAEFVGFDISPELMQTRQQEMQNQWAENFYYWNPDYKETGISDPGLLESQLYDTFMKQLYGSGRTDQYWGVAIDDKTGIEEIAAEMAQAEMEALRADYEMSQRDESGVNSGGTVINNNESYTGASQPPQTEAINF